MRQTKQSNLKAKYFGALSTAALLSAWGMTSMTVQGCNVAEASPGDSPKYGEVEQTIQKAPVNGVTGTAGPTFTKCQVKHSASPVYPSCPTGFVAIDEYAQAKIQYYDIPASKIFMGISTADTNDGDWFHMPYGNRGSGVYTKESTLACTVCSADINSTF